MYQLQQMEGKEILNNWNELRRPNLRESLAKVVGVGNIENITKVFETKSFQEKVFDLLVHEGEKTIPVAFVKDWDQSNLEKCNEIERIATDTGYSPAFDYSAWTRQETRPIEMEIFEGDLFKEVNWRIANIEKLIFVEKDILMRMVCTNLAYVPEGNDAVRRTSFITTGHEKIEMLLRNGFAISQVLEGNPERKWGKIRMLKEKPCNCKQLLGVWSFVENEIKENNTNIATCVEPVRNVMDKMIDIMKEYELEKVPHNVEKKSVWEILQAQPKTWQETATHDGYTKYDLWNDGTNITTRLFEAKNDVNRTRKAMVNLGRLFFGSQQEIIVARRKAN